MYAARKRRGYRSIAVMRAFETLIYEKEGAVARISLDRPDVLNAYKSVRDDSLEDLGAVAEDGAQSLLSREGFFRVDLIGVRSAHPCHCARVRWKGMSGGN